MQTARRTDVVDAHDRANAPQIWVRPGEEFWAETELCSGDWLHSIEDVWTKEKATHANPTVVIGIEGARPGMMLAVDILEIEPDGIGYSGFTNASNPLASRIWDRDWGHNLVTLRIEEGFVQWPGGLRLPIAPMIGTLGTAPAGEPIDNTRGGFHGGNMDAQEISADSTVYLPVEAPGALLHIGDAHAIQGDGEINSAGGVECRARVRLRVRLMERFADMRAVRVENAREIGCIACLTGTDESFEAAAREMVSWMCAEYGFRPESAYLLMGQVMRARCTQFVNPTRTYVCTMPKWALKLK